MKFTTARAPRYPRPVKTEKGGLVMISLHHFAAWRSFAATLVGPTLAPGMAGDPGTAEAHLSIATAMYSEMDMKFWLAQSEAAQREVS